ncbi:DEKNAAC100605 [Brettanomyces naardenensis]|uniref:DEKNAAC100605 n=1 Tax=Brettanomyces naardenensis TaxID=13370 RepID=A0A448YFH9_BRENA|nr:DEKNAAC100605 [Brettanomyces naardenensis]
MADEFNNRIKVEPVKVSSLSGSSSEGTPESPSIATNATKKGKKRATLFQMIRLAYILTIFIVGCLSIVGSQVIISFLFYNDEARKQQMMQFTKQNFVILFVHVTSVASPTELIVTFDDSAALKHAVRLDKQTNRFSVHLDPHAIVIANHQIYSDWLFIWYMAYLNKCADQIYIVMKKSLEKIPIIGYGMKNYSFVFLSRNWANDRDYMNKQFQKISQLGPKCWLLIFPEGTNMSNTTFSRSNKFADEADCKPTQYVLLPRARGLYMSCKTLGKTTKTMYDLTIAYDGHSSGEMAQDIYSLANIYLFGKGPKTVSIHVSAINIHTDISEVDFSGSDAAKSLTADKEEQEIEKFSSWLTKLWHKKDTMMGQYYDTGKFSNPSGKEYRLQLRLRSRLEILNVFLIPFLAYLFGYVIYKFVRMSIAGH